MSDTMSQGTSQPTNAAVLNELRNEAQNAVLKNPEMNGENYAAVKVQDWLDLLSVAMAKGEKHLKAPPKPRQLLGL